MTSKTYVKVSGTEQRQAKRLRNKYIHVSVPLVVEGEGIQARFVPVYPGKTYKKPKNKS